MTAEQADRAWQAFDKLRLFAVEARPWRPVVHVVTSIPWGGIEDDEYRYTGARSASFEGGVPRAAFRTTGAAREFEEERANDGYDPYELFDVGGRARFAADPLGLSPTGELREGRHPAGIPQFAITPVELLAEPAEASRMRWVYAVVRLGWASVADGGHGFRHWVAASADAVCGVPVVAHADRARAEADAWERDTIARRAVNPFRFGHPQAITRLNEAGYRAMLAELDLSLPTGTWTEFLPHGQQDWVDWYERVSSRLDASQWETVWDMLDQLRFHLVVGLGLHG
jgi:hypothetical protein